MTLCDVHSSFDLWHFHNKQTHCAFIQPVNCPKLHCVTKKILQRSNHFVNTSLKTHPQREISGNEHEIPSGDSSRKNSYHKSQEDWHTHSERTSKWGLLSHAVGWTSLADALAYSALPVLTSTFVALNIHHQPWWICFSSITKAYYSGLIKIWWL